MINENVYRLKKGSYYYVIDQFDSTEEMKDDYFSKHLFPESICSEFVHGHTTTISLFNEILVVRTKDLEKVGIEL
jgi:hypothetical protein